MAPGIGTIADWYEESVLSIRESLLDPWARERRSRLDLVARPRSPWRAK